MAVTDARDFLDATRESYDRTAARYAVRFHDHLDIKAADQAVVSAFRGLVASGFNKRVLDVGCGTGATTALLAGQGVDAFGVDLSPNMVAQAGRRTEPASEAITSTRAFKPSTVRAIFRLRSWWPWSSRTQR